MDDHNQLYPCRLPVIPLFRNQCFKGLPNAQNPQCWPCEKRGFKFTPYSLTFGMTGGFWKNTWMFRWKLGDQWVISPIVITLGYSLGVKTH